jgi:hypothetical protein
MEDKAKGRMKEAAGAVTGDEDKKYDFLSSIWERSGREEFC